MRRESYAIKGNVRGRAGEEVRAGDCVRKMMRIHVQSAAESFILSFTQRYFGTKFETP